MIVDSFISNTKRRKDEKIALLEKMLGKKKK